MKEETWVTFGQHFISVVFYCEEPFPRVPANRMALTACSVLNDCFPLSMWCGWCVNMSRLVTGRVPRSSGNEANKDANCDLKGTCKERIRLSERAKEAKWQWQSMWATSAGSSRLPQFSHSTAKMTSTSLLKELSTMQSWMSFCCLMFPRWTVAWSLYPPHHAKIPANS